MDSYAGMWEDLLSRQTRRIELRTGSEVFRGPNFGGAHASSDKRIILVHTPIHASWVESNGDLFFDPSEVAVEPERLCNAGRGPHAAAIVRRIEQSHVATVRVEVQSTTDVAWLKRASLRFLAASAA